jgi:hypothetical protein
MNEYSIPRPLSDPFMARKVKHKLLLLGVASVAVLLVLLLWHIRFVEGSYLVASPQTQGHEFIHFSKGHVYGCVYTPGVPPEVAWLGSYQHEPEIGWIWTLRNSGRRILCRPHLLYMRFQSADSISEVATEPFNWRNPFFRRVEHTINSQEFLRESSTANSSEKSPKGEEQESPKL